MKSGDHIESTSVLPAKNIVRPAVRRVAQAASTGWRPVGQLLAETGDHQQRVVDPERQAHHRADGQREGVDAEPVGEDVEDPARGEDRTAPKASGINAAIGERKTSRRTTSRIGSASSSPRSAAAIDSSWIALEIVA